MATSTSAPIIPPPAAPPLKPGYATSEGWISLLTVIVGALPALLSQSKLLTNASPLATQIIGLIISGLATIHYTGQRSSLKRAQLQVSALPAQSNALATLLSGAATGTLLVALLAGCSAGSGITKVGSDLGSATSSGLSCESINLRQDVKNVPLLTQVALDLLAANYVAAIESLITTLGSQVVGCAILAIDDVDSATTGSAGSAATTAEIGPRLLRARELERRYGWTRTP